MIIIIRIFFLILLEGEYLLWIFFYDENVKWLNVWYCQCQPLTSSDMFNKY